MKGILDYLVGLNMFKVIQSSLYAGQKWLSFVRF